MFDRLSQLGPEELQRLSHWLTNPLLMAQTQVWAQAYHQVLRLLDAIVAGASNAMTLEAAINEAAAFISMLCWNCRFERATNELGLCALCAASSQSGGSSREARDG